VAHLDYVGHAALTDRMLDCDPAWNWAPVAVNPDGTPAMDATGGMWINLTICGLTRLGYGHAVPKNGEGGEGRANAIKELIGDALRNAAMQFGAALDLWHKGDLHADDDEPAPVMDEMAAFTRAITGAITAIGREETLDGLGMFWADLAKSNRAVSRDAAVIAEKNKRKAEFEATAKEKNKGERFANNLLAAAAVRTAVAITEAEGEEIPW